MQSKPQGTFMLPAPSEAEESRPSTPPTSQPPTSSGFPFPQLYARPSTSRITSSSSLSRPPLTPNGARDSIRESFASPPIRQSTLLLSPLDEKVEQKKPFPSTMLTSEMEKPWLKHRDYLHRIAYVLTWGAMSLGVAAAAVLCLFGWRSVQKLEDKNLCLVLHDDFDTFDTSVWSHEVDLGGFGNGEFEMTTASPNNSFVQDGHMYLVPTLTSDVIGRDAVLDGYTFNLTGCTNTNLTACGVLSNSTAKTVINPVQSARLTTRGRKSIRYGKVEVRAKLGRGDWFWPAIWMLPVNETYGAWPRSGEIDIMEARGNDISYPFQGRDYVRASLNWGPNFALNAVSKTYGWWFERRTTFDRRFNTYVLEWSPQFIRVSVNTRLHFMLDLRMDRSFFERGKFPQVVNNGSAQNPWEGRGNSAPFDQEFFLIMDVAVGGNNGWFPDGSPNKPWLDGSLTAMYDFALKQDEWYSTWAKNVYDRAMVVDYVKMWQLC